MVHPGTQSSASSPRAISSHHTHSFPQEAWLCTRQWPGAGQATVSTATFGLLLFFSTLSRLVSGCYLNPLGGLHLFHSRHGYGWERLIWSIPGQFDSSCHKDQRPLWPSNATPGICPLGHLNMYRVALTEDYCSVIRNIKVVETFP